MVSARKGFDIRQEKIWLLYQLCLGQVARAVLLNDIEAINIDRPIDFAFAEFVMRNRDKLVRQGLVSA